MNPTSLPWGNLETTRTVSLPCGAELRYLSRKVGAGANESAPAGGGGESTLGSSQLWVAICARGHEHCDGCPSLHAVRQNGSGIHCFMNGPNGLTVAVQSRFSSGASGLNTTPRSAFAPTFSGEVAEERMVELVRAHQQSALPKKPAPGPTEKFLPVDSPTIQTERKSTHESNRHICLLKAMGIRLGLLSGPRLDQSQGTREES